MKNVPAWKISKYSGHVTDEALNKADRQRVDEMFSQHMEKMQPTGFDTWVITVLYLHDDKPGITCGRMSDKFRFEADSWESLEQQVSQYYSMIT